MKQALFLAGILMSLLFDTALAGNPILPVIPEAQARFSDEQGCVEPIEEMRKNHMEYILHQRDETVHEGIRTRQYNLNECINCHVSDAPDAPRISSEKHFCNSCHIYAAVSIDCFQCHADRPVKSSYFHSLSPSMQSHHDNTPVGKETILTLKQPGAVASEGNASE
jgi:hypothetical protein